jgi:hypothetical protein
MISHAKISRHRRMFKTLTGLSTEGFKQILPSFEKAWEADLDRRDAGRLPWLHLVMSGTASRHSGFACFFTISLPHFHLAST